MSNAMLAVGAWSMVGWRTWRRDALQLAISVASLCNRLFVKPLKTTAFDCWPVCCVPSLVPPDRVRGRGVGRPGGEAITERNDKTMNKVALGFLVAGLTGVTATYAKPAKAIIGYADVVLDFFDSGVGPLPGPYGGVNTGAFPVAVDLSVVLGSDPSSPIDFLSLPLGQLSSLSDFLTNLSSTAPATTFSFARSAQNGESAEVYVSADKVNFTLLGTARDDPETPFDLAAIGFTDPVMAVRVVGLDNFGPSPGYDLGNVRVRATPLPPPQGQVAEPASLAAMLLALAGTAWSSRNRRRS